MKISGILGTAINAVKTFFKEGGTTRLVLLGVILVSVAVAVLTNLDGCKKKEQVQQAKQECTILQDSIHALKIELEEALTIERVFEDDSPEGEVVSVPDDEYVPRANFDHVVSRYRFYKKSFLECTGNVNDTTTEIETKDEQIVNDLNNWLGEVEENQSLVRTVRKDSSKYHNMTHVVYSYGQLESDSLGIKIIPNIIEVPYYVKGEVVKDRRKNILAPGFGYTRLNGVWNPKYSLMYARGPIGLKFGMLADENYKPKGINDIDAEAFIIVKF